MFRTGTRSNRKPFSGGATGDKTSTQTCATSDTLIVHRDRRRPKRRRIRVRSKSIENETPIVLLKQNDRVRIRTFIDKLFRDSKLPNHVDDLSRYDSTTLQMGRLLGKGTFSSVYKFRSGTMWNENRTQEMVSTKASFGFLRKPLVLRLRNICDSLYFRNSTQKYAIKIINEETLSKDMLVWSVAYLVAEARILSGIDHPHIIQFCGWGSNSSHPYIFQDTENEEDGTSMLRYRFFMVIERLPRILKNQLREWRLEHRKLSGCFLAGKRYSEEAKIIGATSVNHKYRRNRQVDYLNQFYSDRIGVALQLSSAIIYLHERNILHRDVKPHNVGFDAEGNVKLFDFGIAKEIKTSNRSNCNGDEVNELLYKLTGLAGSRSYMSPENGLCKRYNAKTDVYSFSMVLWELMTLQKLPHVRYSTSKLEKQVWMAPNHERPSLSAFAEDRPVPLFHCDMSEKVSGGCVFLLEKPIRDLLERCWSPTIRERPTMKSVHQVLRNHMLEISFVTAGAGHLRQNQCYP